jgi:GntR family transcriptional regulator / MocR family aminotransferase
VLLTLSGSGPLFQQVYRALRESILSGRLRQGDRLPVTRALSRDLGISRNVVLIAYEQLIAEGYAAGRVGAGTFVAQAVARPVRAEAAEPRHSMPRLSRYAARILSDPAADPPLPVRARRARYDFSYYLANPEDFPAAAWRRLLARHLRNLPLDYSSAGGDAVLRREIAHYLGRTRGIRCEPGQVLLVNGTQQVLDLTARVLLNPGDRVVMEDPHYAGAREVFRAVGARIVPVPVDGAGLDTARLPRKARLAYVTPSHQFPTGAVLPLERRLALLEWAAAGGAYVLEDDYGGEYRYGGRPLEAVQALDRAGCVLYTGSFSRILFPSLRMGYLVASPALVRPLGQAKWIADRHTSLLQQAALADFLREGHLERAVRRARQRHLGRRNALLSAVDRHFGATASVLGADAGVHVLLRLPELPATRTAEWIGAAARVGVKVGATAHYYVNPPAFCELLLGYAGVNEAEIAAGIRLLAACRPG